MRRLALAAALGAVALVLAVVFLWPAQRVGPEPIAFGRDGCARCRMLLSQPGFAGELRDARGVLTKYDDIGCLLRAMRDSRGEMPEAWVEDHEAGELVPLLSAALVRSSDAPTPMGYGIVAFASQDAARTYVAQHGGELVTVEDLIHEIARPARPAPPAADQANPAGQLPSEGQVHP